MSNRARSYASATSNALPANREQYKKTQTEMIDDLLSKVDAMYGPNAVCPNEEKVAFAAKYCNLDTLRRNIAYTVECPKMLSNRKQYEEEGYTVGQPDKHSKTVCSKTENSVYTQKTVRLCSDPNCTYYHNKEYARGETVCLYDLFGVCRHTRNHHHTRHHCTMSDLPSFCFKRMDCGEYTIFFYHDMIRYYDKKTSNTYVYEFTNRETENDCILNITNELTVSDRNMLMNKLRDVCYVVHNIIMYSNPLPFTVCQIKDNNTYISSIPQLFGVYIYNSILTVNKLSMFKQDNGKITGMLMEMDNIELVKLVDLNNLHEKCLQAHTILHSL